MRGGYQHYEEGISHFMQGVLNPMTHGRRAVAVLLVCLLAAPAFSQVVDIPIVVSDDAGGIRTLRFGLDPLATDSLDNVLGEEEYPPTPPAGVFDARFIGQDIQIPLGEGTIRDYRKGDEQTVGTVIHELKYQASGGQNVHLSWKLPDGVVGRLQDLVLGTLIDVQMLDSGQFTVTNPSVLQRLKLTITYGVTGVQANEPLPDGFRLHQNYPNPANPTTTISFSLPNAGDVGLDLYDLTGQRVATLAEGRLEAGTHRIELNAGNLASGIYFYRLQAGTSSSVKRLAIMR